MPIIMMTGGHAGLGFVSARNLAERYGCSLILAGRNQKRLSEAAQQLRAVTGANIEIVVMDLSSMASVRAAALRCKTLLNTGAFGNDELAGILCNAGVQFKGAVSISVDGYEETFAANYLGHFLLTNLLLDSLAPNGRLVLTTSGTHDPATMDGRTVGAAVEPDAKALAHQGRSGRPISGGRREGRGRHDGTDAILRGGAGDAGGRSGIRQRVRQVFPVEKWGDARSPILGRVIRRQEGSQALERLPGTDASARS